MDQRWQDQDPALKKALDTLRQAPSHIHAKIALNIISVIVEHRLEALTQQSVSIATAGELLKAEAQHAGQALYRRRWYDVNETLRAAMLLLEETPEELQLSLVPSICNLIEASLQTSLKAA